MNVFLLAVGVIFMPYDLHLLHRALTRAPVLFAIRYGQHII